MEKYETMLIAFILKCEMTEVRKLENKCMEFCLRLKREMKWNKIMELENKYSEYCLRLRPMVIIEGLMETIPLAERDEKLNIETVISEACRQYVEISESEWWEKRKRNESRKNKLTSGTE
jgi:CRISPR/Cas system CMR-associated protein Cmr5 small subunit